MKSTRIGLLAVASLAVFLRVALAVQAAAPIDVIYPDPQPVERIRPITLDGTRYVSTNDLARVFRATTWDSAFPKEKMLPALEGTLADLGIQLREQEKGLPE